MKQEQGAAMTAAPAADQHNGQPLQNAPAQLRAIGALPEGTVVWAGDTRIDEEEDKIKIIRNFIKNKVLKQFGAQSVNGVSVSQIQLAFNNDRVSTNLKLPKVKENQHGVYVEDMETYYKRVLPEVRRWFMNSMFNSNHISIDKIEKLA